MRLKDIFAVFAALVLIPAGTSQAWIGGPFSNNNYNPGGDDGIYEAVAVITNGTGMFRWHVGNDIAGSVSFTNGLLGATSNVQFQGLSSSTNPHVWYYRGTVYFGVCWGSVNSAITGDKISVVGNASDSSPRVEGTGDINNPVVTTTDPTTTQVPVQLFTTQNGNVVPTGVSFIEIENPGFFANSFFRANFEDMRRLAPNRNFSGSGEVTFSGVLADQIAAQNALQNNATVPVSTETNERFFVFGTRTIASGRG
ncbi:MAG: hypothetical protein AAF226_04650 [Verrucomicrobiota bacterium]